MNTDARWADVYDDVVVFRDAAGKPTGSMVPGAFELIRNTVGLERIGCSPERVAVIGGRYLALDPGNEPS